MKRKRDAGIELARVLACCIVIGVHTLLPVHVESGYDSTRVMLACLFADGVAIFWMLTGCFLFQKEDYKAQLRRLGQKLGVPLLLLWCVWTILGNTLMPEYHYHWSLESIKLILSGYNPMPGLEHTWYLFIYAFLILLLPLLTPFVKRMDENPRIERNFVIFAVLFFAVNDLVCNALGNFEHHAVNGVFPAAIEVLLGHILYRYRDKLAKATSILIAVVAFLGLNLGRALVQFKRYTAGNTSDFALYWYTLTGVLCAFCVIILSVSVAKCLKLPEHAGVSKAICGLGGLTFVIYLIHMPVVYCLDHYGFRAWLVGRIVGERNSTISELAYTLAIIVVVFAISCVLAALCRAIKRLMVHSIGSLIKR